MPESSKTSILMIINDDLNNHYAAGIFKKVFSQVKAFNRLGYDVRLVCFRSQRLVKLNPLKSLEAENDEVIAEYGNKWAKNSRFLRDIAGLLEKEKTDGLYIRFFPFSPFVRRFLRRVGRMRPRPVVFMEFPTFPYHKEYRTWKEKIKLLVDKLYRRGSARLIQGAVTFNKADTIYGVPALQIQNGIEVESVQAHLSREWDGKELHLIAVANVSEWHGYDRVIAGFHRYYSRNETLTPVYFHIVGAGKAENDLRELTERHGLGKQVIFHGPQYNRELDDTYRQAHIGIGTLGLHRKDVWEESSLKHREYCARGLPFVCTPLEIGFPAGFSYCLRVPADESPVDIQSVVDFARNVYQDKKVAVKMRDYATQTLTWEQQLRPVAERMNAMMRERKE